MGNVLSASCNASSKFVAFLHFLRIDPKRDADLICLRGNGMKSGCSANVMSRKSAPVFLRTRSRSIASPRCNDSRGMLAEVSSSTVTAKLLPHAALPTGRRARSQWRQMRRTSEPGTGAMRPERGASIPTGWESARAPTEIWVGRNSLRHLVHKIRIAELGLLTLL